MTKDMISVIVPCYNVEKYIDDCIESLKNQTYKNFEVIFVNDGSKDNTLQKIKTACEQNENFKYVDQINGGLPAARNSGIAVCQGEYVCFVDSDDFVAPNYLENLLSAIKTSNADFACCKYKTIKEEVSYFKTKFKNVKEKLEEFGGGGCSLLAEYLNAHKLSLCVWNKIYKREILKEMENWPRVFNEKMKFAEDVEFNFRYIKLCEKATLTNQVMCFYRIRKKSLIHSSFNKKMLLIFEAHKNNLKICQENGYDEAEIYVRAHICLSAVEMLFRMHGAKYKNSETISKLYQALKDNSKYLKKAKKIKWYKRLAPIGRPVLRILLRKQLKQK